MNLYNWLNSLFSHIPSVTAEKVEDFLMALQLKTIYRIGLMEEKEKERGGRERRRRKREEEGKEEDNFFYTRHRKSEAFAEHLAFVLKKIFSEISDFVTAIDYFK